MNASERTREEALLRSTSTDARPPALIELLDLLDELALDEVHLVVLLRLVGVLNDRAEALAGRRVCWFWLGLRLWFCEGRGCDSGGGGSGYNANGRGGGGGGRGRGD